MDCSEYKRYFYYNHDDYIKLNNEKEYLSNESKVKIFKFIGIDGKVEDKKKYSVNQYNNVSSKERLNLNPYAVHNDWNSVAQKEERKKDDEITAFIIEFKKTAKQNFINDFADENEISFEKADALLEYSLNNLNNILKVIDQDSDEFEFYWTDITYDKFINPEETLSENVYLKVENMMKNTLNLFNAMMS